MSGRKRGSRRDRRDPRSYIAHPSWHERTPPGEEYVTIRFLCQRRGHAAEVVGEVCSNTHDAAIADESLREPWMKRLLDGTLPEDATSPTPKPLLQCTRCGHELQLSLERMRLALSEVWEPHSRRVVDEWI